jgi:hypothetical protein
MIYTLVGSSKNTISFDCVTGATVNREATITEFPTEQGSPVTDHIFFSNIKITISGVVSDFNFYNPLTNSAGSNVYFDANGNILGGQADPTNNVIAAIKNIYNNRELITVVITKEDGGQVESFENCLIGNISVDDKPDNGDATTFNLSIQQIRTVTILTQNVEKAPELLKTSAQKQAEAKAAEAAAAKETVTTQTKPALTEAQERGKAVIDANTEKTSKAIQDADLARRTAENLEAGRSP